ncbi:MAG: fumarate reductase/succinate dehydrogenase flavoprotein subunit [Alphaproteobacteria bacterium]|nr:fumarate reductase/succinate dehydrogenase flavoprotein subunit [Alphaproteobacteria bacterium]MCB9693399.1 fumarate reductase/succinate dehydrogenase flavoprotein subunit [Alphaproteobacteria bacterium]
MTLHLESKVPDGDIETAWSRHRQKIKLVNPANKRKYTVIVVGTGLAGASAAATLSELGYHVKAFSFHDSPRRAHSIAAQGGINAAKNYQNDGDSVYRLFYDTVKGGDFRAREENVYRLAQVSVDIIDHCAAQGVPFAREYGGLLANRSFGGALVSRTFYARGQTGQQLLLGAYQALSKEIARKNVEMHTRKEMLDVVLVDGHAKGIVTRCLRTGKIERFAADAVVLATGGYGNVFYLSTNARASNVTASWRAYKRGAGFANPCFTQIHPTCIPVMGDHQSKLTLMSESLRNDGRVWVPKQKGDFRKAREIPDADRDYYLERIYPTFGNLVPRDVASRAAKRMVDDGHTVVKGGEGVFLDFAEAIQRLGRDTVADRYGNLFEMYERITGDSPFETPMKIYPAVHYTMGGLWVDYNLMTNVPGLYALGECNFSDHGANRLGASALMQGLADGYFVLPYTIGDYLATQKSGAVDTKHTSFDESQDTVQKRIDKMLAIKGKTPPNAIHRKLGKLVWEHCGMGRTKEGLEAGLAKLPALREQFWNDLAIAGSGQELNQTLEQAGRVADFLEFAEVKMTDALTREESCGGHFREEHQHPDGEAKRDDENFCHGAVWEYTGEGNAPIRNQEPLSFRYVKPSTRSYK